MKTELNNTDNDLYFEAMNRLSKTKQTQVANVCYANVAMLFAMLCNTENQGPNFEWKDFPALCVVWSETWIEVSALSGNKKLVNALAAYQCEKIAEELLGKSGFIRSIAK